MGILIVAPASAHAAPTLRPEYGTHSFYSAAWIHSPIVSMSARDPDPGAGDIFGDAQNSIQAGPVILDPQGRLIWFDPLPNRKSARDVQVQRYQGQPVLTFWQGRGGSVGVGVDVMLNDSYEQIATVGAGDGAVTDSHDFEILPNGDALISAQKFVHVNLSSVGGARDGVVRDDLIQEVDIATGQVMWQWSSYGHVSLRASYAPAPAKGAYDFFHLNSIQQLPNGNLLISARNTWATYEISETSGRILWTLGGKHSSFKVGRGANFEWQHDASMRPDGTLSVFDDASVFRPGVGIIKNERQSRAIRIRLNFKRRRATLVRAYTNTPALSASSEGSVQILPNGNTFVGWGSEPYFTEFSRTGRQLFSGHFPAPMQMYRAYRFQWSAQPNTPPAVAVRATAHGTRVYASWNGATDVAAWQVLAGSSASAMTAVGSFKKTFFETEMWFASIQPYFAVRALGKNGQLLGISGVVAR